jgi:hypothetical protein
MGTTSKTTYRIECRTNDNGCVNGFIRGMHTYGMNKKPKDLKDWCEAVEKSELPGGPNQLAALRRGYLLSIFSAQVIRQSDETVVDEYKAAPFRTF